MLAMLLRTTMPSAPYDLSIWNSCVVATPLAFHTIQVSTVVAAHWMSPDATARCRLACGIFLRVTSRPFLAKMPASLARVSGAKPVQPEMPMATLVPCASAGVATKDAASAAATNLIDLIFRSIQNKFCIIHAITRARPSQTRAPKSSWRTAKKGRSAGSGPLTNAMPQWSRRRASPDIGDAFLSFHLSRGRRLGGKLKHSCFLAFEQIGQEHHLAIRKFERIVMHPRLVLVDLPEDRGPMLHP